MKEPTNGENADAKAKPGLLERYVLFSLRHPLQVFCVLTVLLVLSLGVFGLPNILSETQGDEWLIKSGTQTQRDMGLEDAVDQFGESSGAQPERSEDNFMVTLTMVYKSTKGSIFSDENVASIKEVEESIWGSEEYSKFCKLEYEGAAEPRCARPASPLNVFYKYNPATGKYGDRRLTSKEGLQEMKENYYANAFYVTKTFNETGDADHSRSQFMFGLPIVHKDGEKTYNNSYTDASDQVEYVVDEYLSMVRDDLFDKLGMKASGIRRSKFLKQGKLGDVEVLFYAPGLENDEFLSVIVMDFSLAILSIFSVWIYMLIHLGSIFLATVGIFEVFVAFPVALFVYKLVFQIAFFDFLHLLVIFILLGIGADDVFVFTDAFKQSKAVYGVGNTLESRLVYTCKRASKAVFVTSFTTMAAFLASAASGLMPMQSFGIFAALCIVFLFLINVLLMPATLVLWSGYTPWCVKNVCCCFEKLHKTAKCTQYLPCCTCCHITPDDTFVLPMGTPYSESTNNHNLPVEQEMSKATQHVQTSSSIPLGGQQDSAVSGDENVLELRAMERFFNGTFYRFISASRWPIIICFSAVFAVGLWQVTGFEPPSETERWWPDAHTFTKVAKAVERSGPFVASKDDAVAVVHLVWGIKGMSSDYSTFDPDDFGSVEYDDAFDPTSEEAQMHLLDVCRKTRVATCRSDASECKRGEEDVGYLVLLDRSNGGSLKEQAPCWIEAFDDWLKLETTAKDGLPLDPKAFKDRLKEFTNTNIAKINFPQDIGWIDTGKEEKELKFVQFRFDSTYQSPTSYAKAKPVLDSWDDFMKEMNAVAAGTAADGVSRGYDTGREAWTWPQTQNSLVRSAVQGVGLVFVLAFFVLNIATQNIVISSISVVTIAGIVLTVLGVGIRGIMGWKLGIAESIVATILVGFSMDYTLHLADAYVESHHTDRLSRTRDSLTHLGISVTAGAITTFISGIFLWFATVVFFTKFAFNITATILASYLWSILFFPAACMVFGPEGKFGDWRTMIYAVASICKPREK